MIKNVLSEQLKEPSDQFVKAILSKGIYSGVKTQNVIDRFRGMVKFAFNEYINELINDKIKNAFDSDVKLSNQIVNEQKEKNIEFDSEELDLLDYINNMINENNIIYKKTDRYISLQLGENVRKWICRIYIKKNSEKTLILHKYEQFEQYEHEYYFEDAEQLEQIKDLILRVVSYCKK